LPRWLQPWLRGRVVKDWPGYKPTRKGRQTRRKAIRLNQEPDWDNVEKRDENLRVQAQAYRRLGR
jgi:hypothetical protein